MIKRAFRGFPWIFATYLSVLLYFLIWRFSWALLAIFAVSCLLAIWRKFWGIFAVLLVVASVSGFVKAEENRQMADQPKMLTEVTPQLDTVEVNGDLLSFRAVNSGHIFQVYYTLKSQSEQAFWSHLDDNVSVTFDGALDVPESVRNFNGFDYQKYLATQGIYRVVTIKTVRSISKKTSFLDLRVLRRRAILLCETRFPKPMANYLTGLLFGYLPKDFDAEMGDIYSSLGIIHLFALSGMQVNFFIDWLRKILLRLGMRRDRVDQLMLPFSIVYAFLTGLSVSVIRALVQKSLPFRTLDNFSATFFVLLFLMPKFLLTTGGALTMLYAFLLAMLRGKFTSLDTIGIKKTLVASTVLSVGVLPLLVLDFHVFQPLSIVLTFAFSVLFDVVLLPLLVLIFALSALTNISLNLNVAFVSLENLVKGVNQLISHPLTLGTPSVPVLLAMFAVTGLLIDFYTHKTKTRAFACFLVLLALFALAKFPLSPSITMVDIGQGDSFLLEDRLNAHTVLIDTGGKVSFGGKAAWQTAATSTNAEKTLIPYLQSRGISALDTVILTHSDADHCGDIIALASKITIREIWVSAGSLTVPDFVMKLKQTHSQIHVVKTGDTFPIFDTSLQVLSSGYTGRGDNNDSIVTYGDFYGTKWLFTGDLERLGEKELLANYPTLQVDVLKAGHHGSKTASDPSFIQQIHPKFALISCGINNRYHHPNEETLATFNTQKIPYIRTDQHGAVRFNGPSWQIETVK